MATVVNLCYGTLKSNINTKGILYFHKMKWDWITNSNILSHFNMFQVLHTKKSSLLSSAIVEPEYVILHKKAPLLCWNQLEHLQPSPNDNNMYQKIIQATKTVNWSDSNANFGLERTRKKLYKFHTYKTVWIYSITNKQRVNQISL